jgi:hypothetical protein
VALYYHSPRSIDRQQSSPYHGRHVHEALRRRFVISVRGFHICRPASVRDSDSIVFSLFSSGDGNVLGSQSSASPTSVSSTAAAVPKGTAPKRTTPPQRSEGHTLGGSSDHEAAKGANPLLKAAEARQKAVRASPSPTCVSFGPLSIRHPPGSLAWSSIGRRKAVTATRGAET